MTDKPIPTAQAVDLLAGAQYQWVSAAGGGMKTTTGEPVPWAEVPEALKIHQRQMSLDLLLAVYPQIVSDVLRHYATVAHDAAWADTSWWLERRAAEVEA